MQGLRSVNRLGYAWLVPLIAVALLALPGSASAAGTPNISLNKSSPGKVLYGATAAVTLEASNPAGQPTGYNLSFRDVLPNGVSYVPGSAGSLAGEPQILNDSPATDQTTLIWSNVSDLTPGSSYSLGYQVAHDPAELAVPDTYTNNAGAYINCDPRYVPDFGANGAPVQTTGADCTPGPPDPSYTGSATDSATTELTPIEVSKSSPDGQILRGIHDHVGAYTITVDNNLINPSNDLEVVDYLQAGVEFVGCGGAGIDNTTDAPTNPGSADEYPGSGPIAESALAGCVDPDTVETVLDPAGLPAGVYTKLTWDDLGDMAAGDTITLRYLAGVPIRENTIDWNGAGAGNGTAPATDGDQGANLDNNSGPETNEDGASAKTYGNFVTGSADYQVPGDPPLTVSDDATASVTPQDLRIFKSVAPGGFTSGTISTWTLTIDTGEYRYVDDLVVTDTLGDGYCPLGSLAGGNLEETPPPASSECDPTGPPNLPSAPYESVQENSDGTWTIVWDETTDSALARIQPSSSHTITFPTNTRVFYQQNFADDTPILANDAATNSVALTGDDFIICAPGQPDLGAPGCSGAGAAKIDADEADGTEDRHSADAGQAAPAPSIDKRVNDTANADLLGSCLSSGTYVDSPPPTAAPGDHVCFRLRMDFPARVETGTVAVTDFVPPGTTYLPGSTVATPNNTVTIGSAVPPEPDVSGAALVWPLGDVDDNGETFEVVFAVVVGRTPTSSDGDITDNLMKSVFQNTAGTTFPLRDAAAFELEQPELDLVKGVRDINNVPAGGRGPNVDGGTVYGGDVVTYRVDVSNGGSLDADSTQVWDVLPPEVSCADLSAISNGGACNSGPSPDRIEWSGLTVPAGGSLTLTYDVTIPDGLTGGDRLDNTAGVRQYQHDAFGGPFTNIPQTNIDPTQNPGANAPAADDPSFVTTGRPTVVKTRTTEINEAGNNLGSQATIGEQIAYTVTATIPAGTSLYGADTALVDALGARKTLLPGSASATLDNDAGGPNAPVSLPTAGLALTEAPANTLRIDFPDPYNNPTGSGDDVIVLTFTATVDDDYPANRVDGTAGQRTLPNSATLSYRNSDGDPLSNSGSVNTSIVEPDISIGKAGSNNGAILSPGENVTFTLTAGNAAGASVAHDNTIVDTIPVGLTPVNGPDPGTPVADGAAVDPDGGIWDETARTITWDETTTPALAAIQPGPAGELDVSYKVIVDNDPVGASTVKNTAGIVTSSLPDGADDDGERDSTSPSIRYADGAELESELVAASISKSSSPTSGTIGDEITHTLTATIPANVRHYDTTVVDDVPDGLIFGAYVSATCTAGCTGGGTDITPSDLTPVANGDDTRIGWYLGDLDPAPTSRTVELVYTTNIGATYGAGGDVADGDQLINTATLAFNQTDQITTDPTTPPDPAGFDETRESSSTTDVDEPAIGIDKDVSGQVGDSDARDTEPGDSYSFSIAVTNAGTAPAYDVLVTDQPDAELENVVVATDADWTVDDDWSAADPDIRWTIPGPIAPGDTVTLTYTADLVGGGSLSNGQQIVNTADVPQFFGVPEAVRTDPANSGVSYRTYTDVTEDTVTMTVNVPALTLDKTTGAAGFPDDAPAQIEQPFPWRIVITNPNAGGNLIGVDLTDTLPKNWTYEAGSAVIGGTGTLTPGGQVEPSITTDADGDLLSWSNLGDLAGGETLIVDFEATPDVAAALDPGVSQAHLNDATAVGEDGSGATGSADGPYADDDDATATLGSSPADIAVSKVADDATPVAGTETTWTLVVTNNGPATAADVQLSDVIPAGLSYVDAVPDQGTCGINAGTLECDLGAIASGNAVNVALTTLVDADQAGATILNSATVSDPTINDSNPANDTDDDSIDPTGEADVAIEKGLAADLRPGVVGTYELTVTNAGPSLAEAVIVNDQLPAELSYREARGATCNDTGGGLVECDLGDLVPGAVVVIEIDVDVNGGGPVTNTAEVDSDTSDPNPTNNTDERTDIAGNADLAINKTAPPSFVEGEIRGYTLEVSNVNDITSVGTVTVADEVPEGLEIIRAYGNGWDCNVAGQQVTCTRDDPLTPGSSFPLIRIRATPVAGYGFGTVVNTATVAIIGDLNPDNDTDSTETPSGPREDVKENAIAGKCGGGSLSLSPRFVWVAESSRVRVLVEDADGNAVTGVPVVLEGKGKARGSLQTKKTKNNGRASFNVRAKSHKAKWVASVAACELKKRLRAKRQTSCSTMKLRPRTVPVAVRSRLKVRLRAPDGSPLSRVRVRVSGQGTGDSARTNGKGIAKLKVEPDGAGLLTVRAPKATTCKLKLGAVAQTGAGGQLTG